jgi:hypothetical protein
VCLFSYARSLSFYLLAICVVADPARQFALLRKHITDLRSNPMWSSSPMFVFVERNLGFEAEHHQREFSSEPGVSFYLDAGAQRYGVLTTNEIKHAMSTVANVMLREGSVSVHKERFVCAGYETKEQMLIKFREQLHVYSYSFKEAASLFTKQQVALSGKVGGCVDDICICFQLGLYFTQPSMMDRLGYVHESK